MRAHEVMPTESSRARNLLPKNSLILFQEADQYKIVIKKNLLLSRLGEVQGPFT